MNKYWERRKAEDLVKTLDEAEKTSKFITSVYRKSSILLNDDIDKIFTRYKTKHSLMDDEAKKIMAKVLDKADIESILSQLKKGVPSETKRELISMLEAPAYKSRIDRLKTLQSQIDEKCNVIFNEDLNAQNKLYSRVVQNTYQKEIFNIQQASGLGFDFAQLDEDSISSIIKKDWSGKHYSKRLWGNTKLLAETVKEELSVSLLTGRSSKDVANMLMEKFNVSAFQSRRLVRTETAYFNSQAQMEAYKECEVDEYIFLSTLDKRTSKVCQEMDLKKFKVSEQLPGRNCPPMHPFCRSDTLAVLGDEELSKMERRARDPETGKTYTVPGDMSYEEWKNNYVNDETVLSSNAPDVKQYNRYKSVFDKDFNMSFEEFKEMKYTDKEKYKTYKMDYPIVKENRYLHQRLDYITASGKKGFIPKDSVMSSVKVIAGKGVDAEIREISRLVEAYDVEAEHWSKVVSKIESDTEIYDVHFYEAKRNQYEVKIKAKKEK